MKCYVYLLVVAFIYALSGMLFAEDIFISQMAQGSDSGISCENSHSAVWFNSSTSWANPKQPGKIGPGDIAHLCGVFTPPLSIKGSGTDVAPITVLFENGAKISAPTWNEYSGALTISKNNYITIDGGSNGVIEATDNGTTSPFGGSKTYNTMLYGLNISIASNVVVRNLTIQSIYDRLAGSTDCINRGRAINIEGNSNNITIDSNRLSDAMLIIMGILSNTSGITISNNIIANGGIGVNIAPGNITLTGSDLIIRGNIITGGTKWDGIYDSNCQANGCSSGCLTDRWVHQDGIHIFSQGINGYVNNVTIHSNYLKDFGTHSTGHIYVENGYVNNVSIFNNVLVNTGSNRASLGMIANKGNDNVKILNNTIIGAGPSASNIGISLQQVGSKIPQNTMMKNNILSNIKYFVSFPASATFSVVDCNNYYNGDTSPFYNGTFHAFAWWQGLGNDKNGTTLNPQLDTNYKPTLSTPESVKSGGVNLSSYFVFDKSGFLRPTTSGWTIGAYQSTVVGVSSPSNLRVNP